MYISEISLKYIFFYLDTSGEQCEMLQCKKLTRHSRLHGRGRMVQFGRKRQAQWAQTPNKVLLKYFRPKAIENRYDIIQRPSGSWLFG